MTASLLTAMPNRLVRWVLTIFSFALLLGLQPTPASGQSSNPGEVKKKIKQLKSSFKTGLKAAKANDHSQAYTELEQALQLAEDIEESGAARKVRQYLQKLPKNWGNKAIENENYKRALTHFDKGIKHAGDDAYMHYGKGLALVNLDSTKAGLDLMKKAVEVGNRTGNTRVSGLATERIRDEFVARASKTLSVEKPTATEADSALSALDRMTEYVDPNATSLFYRARALFEKGSFSKAISVAQEGLSKHQGSRSDAAKYHFIIAESQFRTGSKAEACQTFQKATFGDYKARAEHYLKNECDD